MKTRMALLLVPAITLLTGCDGARLEKAVVELNAGTQQSVSALRSFYESMNDFERDFYFITLRFRPTKEMVEKEKLKMSIPAILATTEGGGEKEIVVVKETGLIQAYSDADIQARIGALKALGEYTAVLAKLASSDAPAKFQTEMMELKDNMNGISSHISQLSGKDSTAFTNYAGPISELAGIVGKHWLKVRKKKDLMESVKVGAPKVSALLDSLDTDLSNVVTGIDSVRKQQILDYYIQYYNKNFRTTNADSDEAVSLVTSGTRKQFLDEAKEAAKRLQLVDSFKPRELVAAMRKAHMHVLQLANGEKSDEDAMSDLLADLSTFMSEAERIAYNAKLLVEASK